MDAVFGEVFYYARFGIDLFVKVLVVSVIALMLLRWILLKVSPFGWAAYQVRRLTDPMVWPLAQSLPMPNAASMAPLLVVLIVLLGAFFFKDMAFEVLVSLQMLIQGISAGNPLYMLGAVLYGAISILLVLIFIRIIGSWIPFMRENRLMWTVYMLTEPVMAPFRNMIPSIGMFDLSPIILIFLMTFVKGAISNLLLH